ARPGHHANVAVAQKPQEIRVEIVDGVWPFDHAQGARVADAAPLDRLDEHHGHGSPGCGNGMSIVTCVTIVPSPNTVALMSVNGAVGGCQPSASVMISSIAELTRQNMRARSSSRAIAEPVE